MRTVYMSSLALARSQVRIVGWKFTARAFIKKINKGNAMSIKKLILEGEGVSLDFKKTITNCEKIARTMVAFANNKGGRLLVRVADDGTIKGVKSDDEERYMIEKAAHMYSKPALEPRFEEVYIDHKLVLVVEIEQSNLKPH